MKGFCWGLVMLAQGVFGLPLGIAFETVVWGHPATTRVAVAFLCVSVMGLAMYREALTYYRRRWPNG